jgi:hypothetical protein
MMTMLRWFFWALIIKGAIRLLWPLWLLLGLILLATFLGGRT